MRGEFVDLGGIPLYYYATGRSGLEPPVVLLHGFASSSHLWASVAPQLSQARRVIVPDLLGHGRSGRPDGHPVNLRGHADRVLQLLDRLHVERACIIGHDMGGAIAQLLAVRRPERVAKLGLVCSFGYGDWPPRELRLARAMPPVTRNVPAGWLTSLLRHQMERGYLVPERGTHSVDVYLRPFSDEEGRDALLAHLLQLDPADVASLTPLLPTIAAPTAVIWGEADPFVPASTGRRLASDIPEATAHPLPNVSHFAPEESPEQVSTLLLDLLHR